MFPEKYKNGAFIAQRGSWNRSKKVGYRVLFAEFKDDEIASMEVFVDGWLDGEPSLGRPSSVLMYDDFKQKTYARLSSHKHFNEVLAP